MHGNFINFSQKHNDLTTSLRLKDYQCIFNGLFETNNKTPFFEYGLLIQNPKFIKEVFSSLGPIP